MAVLSDLALALGRVAATRVGDTLKAILGNLVTLDEYEDDAEAETSKDEPLYGTLGFYFRPEPPVSADDADGNHPEGAAEFVGMRLGDRIIPTAYRDLRINAKLNPDEGEVGLAQYRGGFISLKTNDSDTGTSIVAYAVDNDSSGTPDKAHALVMDSEPTNSCISLMHAEGQSITMTKEGLIVLANAAGDHYLSIESDKIVLNGKSISIVGGAMMGSSNPADGDFVMLATALLAWIVEINANMGKIAGALNGGGVGNPVLSLGPPPTGLVFPAVAVPVPSSKAKAAL